MIQVQQVGQQNVSIVVTTRMGGASRGQYAGFNLALHVGDAVEQVEANRRLLASRLGLTRLPVWLDQVHGTKIYRVDDGDSDSTADGSVTILPHVPLVIMTADCLPIVLWDAAGRKLCALHAGWRGLADGIIKKGVTEFDSQVSAFVGPGIGPCHYEVDDYVRQRFDHSAAFSETRPGHYQFDLAMEAKRQLVQAGVSHVDTMKVCTACDERFYSYRRDGETGRFATVTWLRGMT